MYITKNQHTSFRWLGQNTQTDAVILADTNMGYLIAGSTLRPVYIGHRIETIHSLEKINKMKWFFSNNTEDEKKLAFLRQNNISHIFYSANERQWGDFVPSQKEYLNRVFENDEVAIYQLINSGPL